MSSSFAHLCISSALVLGQVWHLRAVYLMCAASLTDGVERDNFQIRSFVISLLSLTQPAKFVCHLQLL